MPPVTPATAGWRSKADNKMSREAAGTWSSWRAENDSDKILMDQRVRLWSKQSVYGFPKPLEAIGACNSNT
jgi:hypothetical protein